MNFIESIQTCYKKFFDFSGRASKSEYWWFQAAFVPLSIFVVIASEDENIEKLSDLILSFYLLCFVVVLASIIPLITVTVRRFHDTNKSGWYFLLGLIPLVGSLIVTVMMIPEGTKGKNKYGPNPISKRKK